MGIYKPIINISGNAATASKANKLTNDLGVAPSYSCRAWVNFNGTGTVAIRASGNVTSITDNGVGDYTVNFTTAMVDANYSCIVTSNYGSAINPVSAPTTTDVRVTGFTTTTGGNSDREYYNAAIFR